MEVLESEKEEEKRETKEEGMNLVQPGLRVISAARITRVMLYQGCTLTTVVLLCKTNSTSRELL